MEKENYIVKNKKYEMVPPDGGWGYMICVAAIINYLAISMFAGSFGMIYKDFMIENKMGSTTVTLLSGMQMMVAAIAGCITSPLLKLMSTRTVALLASFLFNTGVFCTIFANTTAVFFICQGIMCVGIGIIYNTSSTLINEYFLKKRLLAISATQTVSAAGAMFAPYMVKWCLDSFAYRGTLIMISAVSLQTFVAAALMHPVTLHLVKVELEETTEEMKLLVKEKQDADITVTTPTITLTDTDVAFEAKIDIKSDSKPNTKSSDSNNFISGFLDVPLWKKFLLSNASMGPTYCMFGEMIFMLMLPQALYALGWNKDQVAKAIALASFGDLITRAVFVFTSKWLAKIGSQEVYLIAIVIAFVSRLLMLWSENTTAIMVFITFIGIARCTILVIPPLILAETYDPDKFTSALGIFMMVLGVMNMVLGPAVGAIRDLSDSYSTAFYVVTCCYAVVLLLWSIELLYKRSKHKRAIQKEAAEKMKKSVKNKGK